MISITTSCRHRARKYSVSIKVSASLIVTCSIVQQAQLPVAAFWPVLACGSFLARFGSRCLRTSSLTGQRRRRRRPDHPAVFASTSWHHQRQVRSTQLGQTRQYCVRFVNIHFLPLCNILSNCSPLTDSLLHTYTYTYV